jgi:hypothetical protein
MNVQKKICEDSLRWILNIRRTKHIHNYNTDLINDDDGHSYHSMMWTIYQSKTIDKIGLYEWIHTENSKGYSNALNNLFSETTNK